jgi:hypothetical protein
MKYVDRPGEYDNPIVRVRKKFGERIYETGKEVEVL